MVKYKNLELKVKITKEYLENGGIQKIADPQLLEDLQNLRTHADGTINEDSITPRLNAFMGGLLHSRTSPPFFDNNSISEYEHLLQKKTSFDQVIVIDTETEFDKVYEQLQKMPNHLFRGQSEAKWRLYSSLQRNWIWNNLSEKKQDYPAFIRQMLLGGKREFSSEIEHVLGVSNADTINDISVMGFLQHHGCPTPLLDWTTNFRVALYFALDGINTSASKKEIENYLSIYFIDEQHLEGGSVRKIIGDSLDRLSPVIKEQLMKSICSDDTAKLERMKKAFENSYLWDPSRYYGSGLIKHVTKLEYIMQTGMGYYDDGDPASGIIFSMSNNPNIKNQEGAFTFNASPHFPLELQAFEYSKEDYEDVENSNYRFCDCLNINKALVPYIREKLNKDGITDVFIYPSKNDKAKHIFDNLLQKVGG